MGRAIAAVTAAAPSHRRGSDVPRRCQPMSRPRRPSQTPHPNSPVLSSFQYDRSNEKPHFQVFLLALDAVLGRACVGVSVSGVYASKLVSNSRPRCRSRRCDNGPTFVATVAEAAVADEK
ncbi:hypothetical protein NL676_023826 [Syzygium grande]|nr:hypothetical protein NL676_023826 [Syzygium grande]